MSKCIWKTETDNREQTYGYIYSIVFLGGKLVRNLPTNGEDTRDTCSSHWSGRSPGEGNGNPLRTLARKISWTEEPGGYSQQDCTVGHNRAYVQCPAEALKGTEVFTMRQAWPRHYTSFISGLWIRRQEVKSTHSLEHKCCCKTPMLEINTTIAVMIVILWASEIVGYLLCSAIATMTNSYISSLLFLRIDSCIVFL